jgi:peptide/nickel transport system substrate-binding protein
VYINWTTRNQAVADAFSNKDFRIGLSYAINRPQLSEIISDGRGEPAQCSPPPGSPLYDERLATQYTEFDQAKANEYLDKVFPQKDAEGFRLGPDGKRFSFVLTVVSDTGWAPYFAVEGELVAQYWRDVGIDVKLDVVPAAVSGQRVNDNSIEAYIFSTEGGRGLNALFDQRCYVPGNSNAFWGNAWRIWRNDPNNEFAQEPPQWAQEAWARWEAVVQAPTLDQQIKLMKEGVFKDAADNLYLIGLVRAPEEIEVIHARLGNTPDEFFYGFPSGAYHITSPEQWYVKE